jgi:hypothetical protein
MLNVLKWDLDHGKPQAACSMWPDYGMSMFPMYDMRMNGLVVYPDGLYNTQSLMLGCFTRYRFSSASLIVGLLRIEWRNAILKLLRIRPFRRLA